MIRHLFLMIWNQKRRNLGLMLEIFFSFMVLFAVLTFILYNYNNYRQPLGFDYDNVWVLNQDWKGAEPQEVWAVQEEIGRILSNSNEVISYSSAGNNIPYGFSTFITSINHNNVSVSLHVWEADAEFPKVMGIQLSEGRWFDKRDDASANQPIIINEMMRKKLFGEQKALGEVISSGDRKKEVIGVINNYKYHGEFSALEPGYFYRPDTSFLGNTMVIKVRPTANAAFEAKLMKQLSQIAGNWSFEMRYMDEMRNNNNKITLVPIIVFLTISGFLIFNVALGLFGVLYYNINKRKQEIGVRRAMGSTKSNISGQFIGEVIVIATFSLALGLFFAVQFPLLSVFNVQAGIYFSAIVMAFLLIYTLVLICSFYPSRQAAQLQPAVALHEE